MAISDGDEKSARAAMQEHLRGSQIRYRDLLRDLRGLNADERRGLLYTAVTLALGYLLYGFIAKRFVAEQPAPGKA